jgi:4-amino-4-deoxy-L-arabinose transferase-like glycosyltransferase
MLTPTLPAPHLRRAQPPTDRAARRWLFAAAAVLLATLVVARTPGPSDLWDQTQPRTIAYTVDMLVHGGSSYLLPRDAADLPATKPPLYNWLALPAIAIAGRDNAIAHRLPSLLALLLTLLVTAAIGERIRLGVGALAVCMLLASYPIFKLGLLARPDMLLVLFLLCGWWSATVLVTSREGGWLPRAVFWFSFVLAAWTKGPPALLLPLHALLAARCLAGSWGQVTRLGLRWSPVAVLLALGWPLAVLLIDRQHALHQLLGAEVLSRIAGRGPEGHGRGAMGLLTGVLDMPGYMLIRFFPWSLLALAGAIALFRRRRQTRSCPGCAELRLESAVLWVLLVIVCFTLSSGKRADYLAPAYPMAAILAAWWLCDAMKILRRPMVVVVSSTLVMAAVCMGSLRARAAPSGVLESITAIERFTRGERVVMEALAPEDLLLIRGTPAEHLAALLGSGRPRDSSSAGVLEALAAGRTVRLVHEPMHASEALRSTLREAELQGRVRPLWRVAVPWPHLPGLAVECVEVRGSEAGG